MKFTQIFTSKRLFVLRYSTLEILSFATELSCRLKKVTYFREFCHLKSRFIRKGTNLMFMSFLRDEFTLS